MPGPHAVHWVVVADASRSSLFSSDLLFESFATVDERVHPASRLEDHDLVASPPGRTTSGPGGHVSALDRHTDAHDHEAASFAAELGRALDQARKEHRFERLVLVAPPKFLGQLRAALDRDTARMVVASLHHDWTHLTGREIAEEVREASAGAHWGEAT